MYREHEINLTQFTQDTEDSRRSNLAYELEQMSRSMNRPHEIYGTFDASGEGIDEEIQEAYKEIPNLRKQAQSTEDGVWFESAHEAYEDEIAFSKEYQLDFYKYNVAPYLNFRNGDEKFAFTKKIKKIIEQTSQVEMRIYPSNDENPAPYIMFVHDSDWEAFFEGMIKFEKIRAYLKTRNKRDYFQLAYQKFIAKNPEYNI